MSVTPIEGVRYWYNETVRAFQSPSRPSLPLPPVAGADRSTLVVMVDMPNDPANVGPYSVTTWIDVFPPAGSNVITINGPGNDDGAGAYVGRRYWGQVRVAQGLADWLVKFRQCQFHGPDPNTVVTTDPGMIRCYGNAPSKVYYRDCLFDPLPWVTEQGRARVSPYYMGFHGANFDVRRSEFRNIQDPFNMVGPNGNDAAAVTAQETIIEQNWIHKGFYANNVQPPPDGQPHSDGIQFNTGRNFTIRGNYIGGQQVMTGYWTWPNGGAAPYLGVGSNLGDGFFGAGIMIKNEVDASATNKIENVLIEGNWIEGCAHGINHASNPSAPNTFSTTNIRNNKFIPRTGADAADWARSYRIPATITVGGTTRNGAVGDPEVLFGTGAGTYIIRANTMTSIYSGNVLTTTGAAVPIANGGA